LIGQVVKYHPNVLNIHYILKVPSVSLWIKLSNSLHFFTFIDPNFNPSILIYNVIHRLNMSSNRNLQTIIEQVAIGDRNAAGELFKILGKNQQVSKDCYQKIEKYCVRAYQVDPGRVEDAFMAVWQNLPEAIQNGNYFSYEESQLCSYLMKACKNQLLKDRKRSKVNAADWLPSTDTMAESVIPISLKEAIDDALSDMGELCAPVLYDYFKGKNSKKLERKIPLNCILRFFGFVRQSAKGEALLQFEVLLEEAVKRLDPECQYLLQQFYSKSQSLHHLAKKFGVSYGSCKNKRKNCMEKCQRLALNSLKKYYSSFT